MAEAKTNAPSFKVQAEEGGNPRKGSINRYPEEMQQCIHDIVSWFDRVGGESKCDVVPGAPESSLHALEDRFGSHLPDALTALLSARNGGMYMYEFAVLPVEEVLSVADEVEGKAGWAAGSVPLARDVDGNLLVAWGEDGSVREWDAEDGVAEYAQARSLGAYLEDLRNKVLSRRVEFVDGVGVVETQASPVRGASVGK